MPIAFTPEQQDLLGERKALKQIIIQLATEVLINPKLYTNDERNTAEEILEALRKTNMSRLEQIMNEKRPDYWRVIADFLILRQLIGETIFHIAELP